MNKDTEVMPLVRWQFRGLDTSQRKGWLFENLTDSRGRTFDGSVAVGIGGASPQVYAAAMGLESADGILQKWQDAQEHPIDPVEVARELAPVTGEEPQPATRPGVSKVARAWPGAAEAGAERRQVIDLPPLRTVWLGTLCAARTTRGSSPAPQRTGPRLR